MRFDKNDTLATNAIRMLGVDSIEKAHSGHPGIVLDAAPMAYVLWNYYLKVNPQNANWVNRDRFVLSAGHGSAMLYALLHLSGYKVSIDDLKHFRTLDSKTPGHPEYGWTDGVDATTGPLGQGFGMAVGMAMAEKHLAAQYNRDTYPVIDHYTYAIAGDGDLMEGISHEAASLAGRFDLNKLIVLYDSNDISLDGPLANSFDENVAERFKAYGWNYELVDNGNDLAKVSYALQQAKRNHHGPTLVEVKNVIGFGAPNENTNGVHGAALGTDGINATRTALGWSYKPFEVPTAVTDKFTAGIQQRGALSEKNWQQMFEQYRLDYPKLANQFEAAFQNALPEQVPTAIDTVNADGPEATRVSGSKVLQTVSKTLSTLWGGSADLSSSNKTFIQANQFFDNNHLLGRNIPFGVREFAEGTVMNGIALHGGSRIFGSTFMVFSDYMKPAIRLAAMQKLPVIYIFTHDSIAVGEDGPTHEPIEQLESLRGIPGLTVIRPASLGETKAAWKDALQNVTGPTAIILSRQAVPQLAVSDDADPKQLAGYVVSETAANPDIIMLTTGSEVSLGLEVQSELDQRRLTSRVVSIPSLEYFQSLDMDSQTKLIGNRQQCRVAIEFGLPNYWYRYVYNEHLVFGIDHFGKSGDANAVIQQFGLSATKIADEIQNQFTNEMVSNE